MGKIEAARHKWRGIIGKKARQSIGPDRMEGKTAVVSRLAGAIARALLIVVVVATPSVLLSEVGGDAKQMVALVALFAGLLTLAEYNATYPSLIEFRDAPPFNRVRYMMLFTTVFGLTVMELGHTHPTSMSEFVGALGHLIGKAMDFPYSPVRLATLMLSESGSQLEYETVRDAAGVAYFTSLVSLTIFVIILKAGAWPWRGRPFNVWVNLPTFDPSAGGDVVERLERDGRINIALGFLLPFIIPFLISYSSVGLHSIDLTSPQNLIWTVTTWAFLPASLFMRGIAMGRIAEMIRDIRRAKDSAADRHLATI